MARQLSQFRRTVARARDGADPSWPAGRRRHADVDARHHPACQHPGGDRSVVQMASDRAHTSESGGVTMASVIRLPRAWHQADSVDDGGRDAHLIELLTPAATLRWDVSVGGIHHLPKRDGALLVTNSRRFSLSAIYAAWALSRAGRPVRSPGAPTSPHRTPVAAPRWVAGQSRRDPRGVRAGELVVVSTKGTRNPRHAGAVDTPDRQRRHQRPPCSRWRRSARRSPAPPVSKWVRRFDRLGSGAVRWPISSWPTSPSDTSNACSMVSAVCTPAWPRSISWPRADGLRTCRRRCPDPLRGIRAAQRACRADDPRPRCRQARLGHAALHVGSPLPGDRVRQSRRGAQRQAVQRLLARADGRRRRRRARSRRCRLRRTSWGRQWAGRSVN